MDRNKIDKLYKWDLSHIFEDPKEWEELFAKVNKRIPDFSKYQGKLGEKHVALEMFNETDSISLDIEKLYVYAYLLLYLNGANAIANEMAQRVVSLSASLSAATAYITPELLELDENILDAYINDDDFAVQKYSLRLLKENKKHILSKKEELIIARYSEVLGSFKEIFGKINDVDFPQVKIKVGQERITLSHGNYSMLLQNKNQAIRRKAFKTYYKIFKDRINTISACYAASVKKRNITCSLKNYPSALEASLTGDDVPKIVYDTLIREVNKALPMVHEYVDYRKNKIGNMHMYDMYVPIVDGVSFKMDFPEAFELVKKALAPMGEDYVSRLQKMLDERRIDVFESLGKRSGAFSWGVFGSGPYVLLNHTGTTHDIFTIAHELGHAMHSEYSDESLPYAQAGYSIFVAEVASTTNEVLLLKYLLNTTTDEKLKKYLLSYYLDMFRTTTFRQTMFAEFEEYAHNKETNGSLTTEDMMHFYYDLNKKYYGKSVIHDKEIAYEWARIPHFYSAFYVYKYATGLTTAITFATNILSGDEKKREEYFSKFLRAGGKKSPYEIIKDAGVDLATEQPYEIAFKEFEEALALLKKL